MVTGRRSDPRSSCPPRKRAASSSGRTVAERPMRWMRWPGAECSSRSRLSARWTPRFSPTRVWISSTMTRADGAQHVAAARAGQDQVERFGRGDQDVRRPRDHRRRGRWRACRRCAPPRAAAASGLPAVAALGLGADARQRRAQVALDVVVERLEGRDVEQTDALVRAVAASPRPTPGRSRRCPTGRRPASCPSRWARG